jgi:hypothetical protein
MRLNFNDTPLSNVREKRGRFPLIFTTNYGDTPLNRTIAPTRMRPTASAELRITVTLHLIGL